MKNYKNWWKKSAQVYASRKYKTKNYNAYEVSTDFKASKPNSHFGLHVSTDLPQACLHYALLALFALVACCLIYLIDIPRFLSLFIIFILLVLAVYDAYQVFKSRNLLKSLHCIQHRWILLYKNGSRENLKILSISQGLGFLYVIVFQTQNNIEPMQVCIWKYQTNTNFVAYCSQLFLVGLNE